MNPHDPKDAVGQAKPQLHLLPSAGMEEQAKAHRYGAGRYGPWNWRKGKVLVSTYLSAGMRHGIAFRDGEDIDKETGAHHLGCLMANAAILLDAARHGTLVDDRPGKGGEPAVKPQFTTAPEAREPREWVLERDSLGEAYADSGPELAEGESIRVREVLPTPEPSQVAEEWRELGPDEVIQEGDHMESISGGWTRHVNCCVGSKVGTFSGRTRRVRRLVTEPGEVPWADPQKRIDELEDALRGIINMTSPNLVGSVTVAVRDAAIEALTGRAKG